MLVYTTNWYKTIFVKRWIMLGWQHVAWPFDLDSYNFPNNRTSPSPPPLWCCCPGLYLHSGNKTSYIIFMSFYDPLLSVTVTRVCRQTSPSTQTHNIRVFSPPSFELTTVHKLFPTGYRRAFVLAKPDSRRKLEKLLAPPPQLPPIGASVEITEKTFCGAENLSLHARRLIFK